MNQDRIIVASIQMLICFNSWRRVYFSQGRSLLLVGCTMKDPTWQEHFHFCKSLYLPRYWQQIFAIFIVHFDKLRAMIFMCVYTSVCLYVLMKCMKIKKINSALTRLFEIEVEKEKIMPKILTWFYYCCSLWFGGRFDSITFITVYGCINPQLLLY